MSRISVVSVRRLLLGALLFGSALHLGSDRVGAQDAASVSGEPTPLQELLSAIDSLDVERVRAMLADGFDVNQTDAYSATPLMSATMAGSPELVQLLLSAGADPNAADLDGDVALGYYLLYGADSTGHVAIAEVLLSSGADANQTNVSGQSPLHYAAQTGPSLVRTLLAAGAEADRADEFGDTPVHFAAEMGDVESLQALLDAGASPVAKGFGGGTPLMMASGAGSHAGVRLLLDRGADVAAVDETGETAIFYAARADADTVLSLLIDHDAQVEVRADFASTALHHAAEMGGSAAARVLLTAGGDPNAVDDFQRTPLMAAAGAGSTEVVEVLLASGADPDRVNMGELTAIEIGEDSGFDEVVQALLAHGAKPPRPLSGAEKAIEAASLKSEMAAVLLDVGDLPGTAVLTEGPTYQYGAEEEYTRELEATDAVVSVGDSRWFGFEMIGARYLSTRFARAALRGIESTVEESIPAVLAETLGSGSDSVIDASVYEAPEVGDQRAAHLFTIRTNSVGIDIRTLVFTRGAVLVFLSARGLPGQVGVAELAEKAAEIDARIQASSRLTDEEREALQNRRPAPAVAPPALQPGEAVRGGVDLSALLLTRDEVLITGGETQEALVDQPSAEGVFTRAFVGTAGWMDLEGLSVFNMSQTAALFVDEDFAVDAYLQAETVMYGEDKESIIGDTGGAFSLDDVEIVSVEELALGDRGVQLVADLDAEFLNARFVILSFVRERTIISIMLGGEVHEDLLARARQVAATIDQRMLQDTIR